MVKLKMVSLLRHKYLLVTALLLYFQRLAATAQETNGNIEKLLLPLTGLQIAINLDAKEKTSEAIRFPLQKVLRYLTYNDSPLSLCSLTYEERVSNIVVTRHIENRVAWLILRRAQNPNARRISLRDVIFKCEYCTARNLVLYRDLLHLILVYEGKSDLVPGLIPNIMRCSSPFHFIILAWYPVDFISAESITVFDVCFGKSGCRLLDMFSYFDLSNKGVRAAVEHVNGIRRNFLGDHIWIWPEYSFHDDWYSWREFLSEPVRYKSGNDIAKAYYGYVLLTLAQPHNFTFSTARLKSQNECKVGLMKIRGTETCANKDCHILFFVFASFGYMTTLMSSELPTNEPHFLRSLAMPLSAATAATLCSLTVSTAIILVLSSKRRDVVAGLYLLSTSFVSCAADGSKYTPRRCFYVPWMLFTTLIAVIYGTVLQSVVVAPSIYSAELTFDQMIEKEFTFFAFDQRFMKFWGEYFGKLLKRRESGVSAPTQKASGLHPLCKEVLLGEKVHQAPFTSNDPDLGSHLLELSLRNRKVLVLGLENLQLMGKVLKMLGRNVEVGTERFIETPDFWSFAVQKHYLLIKSLGRMKAAALVDEFFQRTELVRIERTVRRSRSNMRSKSEMVDLSDGITGESFVIYSYAILLSAVAMLLEVVWRHKSVIWARRSKVIRLG